MLGQCDLTYREYKDYYIVGVVPKIEVGSTASSEVTIPCGMEFLFHMGEEEKCLKEITLK